MLLLCGKVVILNMFKTGITAVSFLPVLSCVLGVFNSPVATPVHARASWALPQSSIKIYIGERKLVCFAAYSWATTHGLTSLSC